MSEAQRALTEAMAAHQAGEAGRADDCYAECLRLAPGHPQALRLRGVLARERGDLPASLTWLREAAAAADDHGDANARGEYALSLLAAGELARAERELRAACDGGKAGARLRANLAAVLQYRGHLHEAARIYRELLGGREADIELRCNLAATLADAGEGEAALAECDAALQVAPGHPRILAARGAVLIALEQFDEARLVLARATQRDPDDDMALGNLAHAASRLGLRDEALSAWQRALAANPGNARAASDLVHALAAGGDAGAALAAADAFLARHPGEPLLLAARAFALLAAGRRDEAAAVYDYPALLLVEDIAPPEGYRDIPVFNAALAARIAAEPAVLESPASKATRGGTQTGELALHDDPALRAFEGVLRQAVATARSRWPAGHPVAARAARPSGLRAWATTLRAGGQQTPHLHPTAWLSGVYYVAVPDAVANPDGGAGALEFGAPPERHAFNGEPLLATVTPKPGRLVLFPSCFYHRTLPFDAPQPRISMAFDAVPLACEVDA